MQETKREKEIKKEIAKLSDELTESRKRKTLLCKCCGKRTKIKKAIVIACHHYITPHGCTGGDYWTFSNEYLFYCTKCESLNRGYIGSFDLKKWDGGYTEKNLEKGAIEKYRVELYFSIHNNIHLFAERLDNYDFKGTVEELREENQKSKERNWC